VRSFMDNEVGKPVWLLEVLRGRFGLHGGKAKPQNLPHGTR
jgi:hypothetical protein